MDIGPLVAAHSRESDQTIFSYDELEFRAAARAEGYERLLDLLAPVRRLITARQPATGPLASELPAE